MPENEKLGLLYNAMKEDEVFSQIVPNDVQTFVKEYSDPKTLRTLYDALSNDEVFSQVVPNSFEAAVKEYGLGKPSAVPSQSSDGGSAMKPMGVELSGTLPTTLKSEDVQGQVEEFAGGELANIDYEKAAEKLRGQNPIQAALKNTETIENPVEKLVAKQDIYKAASSQYTLNNAEIDTKLSQLRQGYAQVASDFEANKAQYDELLASGDEQGAALIYPVLKEMQDNINWMSDQEKILATKFDDNARAINTLNAGRAAEYKIAQDKGELNTGSLPMATAPFLNLLGANVQFSPDDAFMASAYNAIAPNVVRTLAAATQMNPLGIFGVYDGVEESLLNVADAIEVDTRKYIPKDKAVSFLDDLNMYNGSELIGSLVGSVAGTLGGGGLQAGGAMAFNAAQGFGGMYGWGREAGLTQEQALLVAAPVGVIYGYLGDKGVEAMSSMIAKPSVKKIILEEIKSLGSNPTKNQLLDVFGKALANATKGATKEGFQEVGEFTSEFVMKTAADEVFGVKEEYAKELTLDNFIKGATESFVGGAFGGSVFGTLFGAESKKTYADVVSESATNPIVEEEFRSELNQLLLSNKLTQEQFDQSIASLENAKEVNAKIPANVTNAEARSEAITLIQEKQELTQQVENIEPAMAKPTTDRIAEIDNRLQDISEGKTQEDGKEPVLENAQDGGNEGQAGQESPELRTQDQTQAQEEVTANIQEDVRPESITTEQQQPTTNPQENVTTQEGEIEQGNQSEYQGTDGQQQGGQENRVNQEGDVAQAEVETGGGNISEQSGAVKEEVNPFSELAKLSESLQAEVEKEVNPDSPKSKLKTFADGLRNMKVDTKNTMYSSLPFAPQIFNGAIELAATTIEATGSVIEAFQKAIQFIKDHPDFKKMNASQQKNYIDDATAEITRVLGGNVRGEERTSRFGQNVLDGLKKEGKVSNRVLNQMAADKQYVSRNQDDVTNAAIELVKSLDGDVDAIMEVANSGQVNLDFRAAIIAQVLGKAKADLEANNSPENQKSFLDARNALQQLGTNIGQGESYFNKIYELFPELKVDAFKKKIDSAAKSSVGTNRKNPSSPLAKAMNVAEKTPKIRNDVFNAIGRLFAGMSTLKDVKNLSNAKTKAALRTLLSFGEKIGAEGKDLYRKLIEDAINNGKQEAFNNREEVKAKVLANLKDVNGRIKQPLSESELEKAAEAFTELYDDLASKAIKKEIDREFGDKKKTISGDKNSKVAKLILYGTLDEETTRAKFAEKYGIPYITDEQTAKLEQLANNVRDSKGGSKVAASTQLNNYINKLAANSSFSQKLSSEVKEKFVDISAYIINNILFNPATQAAAITGNTLRAFTKASEMAIKGRFDILTYTFNQTLNKEVTLPSGEVIKLDLGRVKNAVAASLAGIPRLSEYKLQGISRQEQKIRDAKTPLERALRTIFLASAQRGLSAIDASVTPIISSITQYQLVEQMVKDLYVKSGLPVPNKANLQNDVRAIIGFDETQLDIIAEQAYNDIINSPYYKQLVAEKRIDTTKPFPTSAYGLNPNSGEVQIYNEFITRIYEIQSNGFNERFFDIQGRNGFDQTLDFSEQLREIDRYVARNTNEVAFFGRPVGIFGDMADVVSKASGIVPVLKYTGHFPLFINAAFNSAAYFVKMTPLINAIQLAKYKVTGSRGAYSLNANKEFKTPYIVKLDQRNMTTAVLSSTILATSIAALLSNLYDTPEEERDAWTKGNATGFIDNLTAGQKELLRDANGNPLQEGWFYKDGYPLFNYRITPYYGIFNAAAYFHNRDVFERDYFENKIFVEDNPEFKSVLADFMLSSVYMSLQTSSLSEVSKTLQTIVTKPSQKGESMSKKVSRDLEYKLSNLTSNLVPLGRAQKTLYNLYSSADGKDKKAATGFLDRVIMGSLYGDWAVKSNMTDFLGRPVKEVFTTKGLMLGVNTFELSNGEVRTFLDEAYDNDQYAQLFLRRNYAPTSRHSINLPSRIELDGNITDTEVEEVSLQLEEKGYKVKTQEASMLKEQPNFIEYTKVLDDREVNLVNEKSGGLTLSFLKSDTNKRVLNDSALTDYDFKQIMNATYEYARQISMYEMFKDELGDGFRNMLIKKRDSYFSKMSNYGLVIPNEFEVK